MGRAVLMTAQEREFVRALRDVQTRYELELEKERERSDKYAAVIAERDQQSARHVDRILRLRTQLEHREEQLKAAARRNTQLAAKLKRKPTAPTPASTEQIARRFYAKVTKTDDGCWTWTGSTASRDGRGRMQVDGVTRYAHRVAFRVTGRACPRRLTQQCANTVCVNPLHWESE